MKKKFLRIGAVIVFCTVIYYGFNMLLFTGFSDPFLRVQVLLSSDKNIQDFSCNSQYSWSIIEKDKVNSGNLFEMGRPSSIEKYRELQLVSQGDVIANVRDNSAEYANRFPTGEPFTTAYIFGNDVIYMHPEDKDQIRLYLEIAASDISQDNFDEVSNCLNNHITKVETLLNIYNRHFVLFGWLMRIDDSIERDSYSDAPVFKCTDGQIAVTWAYYLRFVSEAHKNQSSSSFRPFSTVGIIGTDGKIYEQSGLGIDMNKPQVALPNTVCVNSSGQSLETYLGSIPNRLIILDRE